MTINNTHLQNIIDKKMPLLPIILDNPSVVSLQSCDPELFARACQVIPSFIFIGNDFTNFTSLKCVLSCLTQYEPPRVPLFHFQNTELQTIKGFLWALPHNLGVIRISISSLIFEKLISIISILYPSTIQEVKITSPFLSSIFLDQLKQRELNWEIICNDRDLILRKQVSQNASSHHHRLVATARKGEHQFHPYWQNQEKQQLRFNWETSRLYLLSGVLSENEALKKRINELENENTQLRKSVTRSQNERYLSEPRLFSRTPVDPLGEVECLASGKVGDLSYSFSS